MGFNDPLYRKYSYIYHLVIGIFLWGCAVALFVDFFYYGGFANVADESLREKLAYAFCLVFIPLFAVIMIVSGIKGIVKHIRIKNGKLDANEEKKKEEELTRKCVFFAVSYRMGYQI